MDCRRRRDRQEDICPVIERIRAVANPVSYTHLAEKFCFPRRLYNAGGFLRFREGDAKGFAGLGIRTLGRSIDTVSYTHLRSW